MTLIFVKLMTFSGRHKSCKYFSTTIFQLLSSVSMSWCLTTNSRNHV